MATSRQLNIHQACLLLDSKRPLGFSIGSIETRDDLAATTDPPREQRFVDK